nr:FecR domain-containing protein [uncultured Pseudodesulfovibrio sp.]
MKSVKKAQILLLMALLFVCSTSALSLASDRPDIIGEVVSVMGTATANQPDGTMRTLDLDAPIMTKDIINTGCKSNIEIVFKDDSVFSQGPDSSTSLDEFVYSATPSTSKILLKAGIGTLRYVTGQVVKQNPDAFSLVTPTTTIGIRGTEVFAELSKKQEEIGVLSIAPGHVVQITTSKMQKTIARAGLSVKASPDGGLSNPSPTSPETRTRVIKAAPQTTQGEIGAPPSKTDLDRRIDAFAAAISRSKGKLGGLGQHPDYGSLNHIALQKNAHKAAESDRSTNSGAGLGNDGATEVDNLHGDY